MARAARLVVSVDRVHWAGLWWRESRWCVRPPGDARAHAVGQLRDLVCAARGPSQAAEQRLTHQSPTMARVLTATGACECEHFVLRAAAQVARVRSQATFLSLRPFIPCRGLLRVAALIVSDCSQQPRLGTKATMQISFRGDLSLGGCGSANKP